jgi:hypothetical protein
MVVVDLSRGNEHEASLAPSLTSSVRGAIPGLGFSPSTTTLYEPAGKAGTEHFVIGTSQLAGHAVPGGNWHTLALIDTVMVLAATFTWQGSKLVPHATQSLPAAASISMT